MLRVVLQRHPRSPAQRLTYLRHSYAEEPVSGAILALRSLEEAGEDGAFLVVGERLQFLENLFGFLFHE